MTVHTVTSVDAPFQTWESAYRQAGSWLWMDGKMGSSSVLQQSTIDIQSDNDIEFISKSGKDSISCTLSYVL